MAQSHGGIHEGILNNNDIPRGGELGKLYLPNEMTLINHDNRKKNSRISSVERCPRCITATILSVSPTGYLALAAEEKPSLEGRLGLCRSHVTSIFNVWPIKSTLTF